MDNRINIRRDINDPSYRYKMDPVETIQKGRGGNTKTIITNIKDISESLETKPEYMTQFFSTELASRAWWNEEQKQTVIKGVFEESQIQDLIFKFIEKYILCPVCKLPELDLVVGTNDIEFKCRASGCVSRKNKSDRLISFIIKSSQLQKAQENANKKKNKKKQKQQQKKKEENENQNQNQNQNENQNENQNDSNLNMNFPDVKVNENDWSLDTSNEAQQKRLQGKICCWKNFASFCYLILQTLQLQRKLKDVSEKLSWNQTTRTLFVCELLFGKNMLEEIPQRKEVLSLLIKTKRAKLAVLGFIERLCGEDYPDLIEFVPHLVKAFYDQDLIEEEFILEWANQKSSKFSKQPTFDLVIEKAKPFVEWLKTAESESSEKEDDN
ncbi:eukaryotic translation initiation factor 5 [Anaeramoeba ignava]|uniref:Eukaryotic translation initiation factor 5 n=1 Tax=Anaeramoeba ignava TaxID=1746090 RepID=A0A9Q0L9V4_ANAIG|nr:eukaryotic translation initiation factor 5 [Anaeramoeba ignava]